MRRAQHLLLCVFVAASFFNAVASNQSAQNTSFGSVVEWVLKTGSRTVIRARVVEAMGLPASDMPVRERGFRVYGERLTRVCAISIEPAHRDLVFLSLLDESTGDGTVWQTMREGRLIKTLRLHDGAVESISNQDAESEFEAQKKYFLAKAEGQR